MQQFIAGGQTSALVTDEINENFTELYNRNSELGNDITELQTQVDYQGSLINTINARPHLVKEGLEKVAAIQIAGQSGTYEPVWHYKIWSNGYFEAETWVSSGSGGVIPRTSGSAKNIFEIDAGLSAYEIPQINYPASVLAYSQGKDLLEWGNVNASIGCVSGVARGGTGINNNTKSASYSLARTDWSTVVSTGSFRFNLYIKICPRINILTPYDETDET